MLRGPRQIQAQLQKLLDACLFGAGFWAAHWFRADNQLLARLFALFGGTPKIKPFSEYIWLLFVIMPAAPFLLELQGFYNRPLLASRGRMAWLLLKGSVMTVLVVIAALFLNKDESSRAATLFFFPIISFILVAGKEEFFRFVAKSHYGRAQIQKRLILVGTPVETARLETRLESAPAEEIEILARLNLNDTPIERLAELLHEHSANGVIISAKHTVFGQVEKAIQACELEGVEAWLLADFFNTQMSRTAVDDLHGRPMLVFRSTRQDSWQWIGKVMLDVVGGAFLLLLCSWIFLIVAVLVKLTSPGPVFFRQKRSGLNGRPFTMLKFRSMSSDAEQRKHEVEALNEMAGPVFKLASDPRVTPIGRFLRKFSIDELPQLVNVVRGEMSLVGPRPLPVDETKRFGDFAHRRRLSVKPGLTCTWQISGRNNVSDFKDWVQLDLEYIDNWSLWLDLKILFRTIPVVFAGTGAR